MKYILNIFLLVSSIAFSQEPISASLTEKTGLFVSNYVGVDNFGALYYTNDATFFKKTNGSTKMYANIQLGKISSINTFNPLKINLYYKDFNTMIILDNRLAEVFKIDFNRLKNYKNVSHISSGYDNTVWVYNQDNLQLELYDHKSDATRVTTLPIAENVLDLKSDYNHCWLLTNKHIYCYNYFGNLLLKIPNEDFESLELISKKLLLKKENGLFLFNESNNEMRQIALPELLIKQFSVLGETLYIYDGEFLHQYQLNIN